MAEWKYYPNIEKDTASRQLESGVVRIRCKCGFNLDVFNSSDNKYWYDLTVCPTCQAVYRIVIDLHVEEHV